MSAFTLASGLSVGLAFGYALQRGRFCTNTGFRDILLTRDTTLFRAWALAVLVQLAGVTVLAGFGLLPVSVPPLWVGANVLGGVAFGVGMVLAGGCSSGTCYRVGEGMAGSLLALITFGLGVVVADRGALAPLERALRAATPAGAPVTLPALLHAHTWWVTAAIALVLGSWLVRSGRSSYRSGGWPWQASGVALGVVGVAAWLGSAASGRDFGLSMTGPLRTWFAPLFGAPLALDWGSLLIAGLLAGSFLSAALHRELRWRVPKSGRLLQSMIGGGLMGVGAQVAGGCTIGHSLTGLSVLSLGSILTTASILLGAWAAAYLAFVRPMRRTLREQATPPATPAAGQASAAQGD